jgi:hypothetical protein
VSNSSSGERQEQFRPILFANRSTKLDVLQYEVVTADGSIKIANECQNQDLFWAMRGGGGMYCHLPKLDLGAHACYSGTFGVNTRVWLKTYPALKAVNTATGTVICKDKVSYGSMVSTLMDLQKPLREAGYTVS